MSPDRVISLNEVNNDFSIEELESRTEMQMLGLGADPSIGIFCTFFGNCYLFIICYLTCYFTFFGGFTCVWVCF